MKNRTQLFTSGVVLSMSIAIAAPRANAPEVVPPSVPSNLEAPAGSHAFLIGHARGTQNYVCLPDGDRFTWKLHGPQATLFDDGGDQRITHFLSANPIENGALRATWQHSGDTSAAWATMIQSSTDPVFVRPDAIPWFLLQVVGAQYGPDGGHKLTKTTYIQRVNTNGGLAPAGGCSAAANVGARALVPYTADYIFYRR